MLFSGTAAERKVRGAHAGARTHASRLRKVLGAVWHALGSGERVLLAIPEAPGADTAGCARVFSRSSSVWW